MSVRALPAGEARSALWRADDHRDSEEDREQPDDEQKRPKIARL